MNSKYYFTGPAAFFSAGPEYYIAFSFTDRNVFNISKKYAFKYSQLAGIKTEENHFKSLLNQDDPEQNYDNYKELLDLLKKHKLLAELPGSSNSEAEERKCCKNLALITCNRTQLLEKSALSIAESLEKKHRSITLTIFDDSEKKEIKIRNRKIANYIKSRFSINTVYIGSEEKKSFTHSLYKKIEEKGINRDSLDFSIFGHHSFSQFNSSGTNRNAALLYFAGRRFLSFDDDTQFKFGSSLKLNNNIEISDNKDPNKYLFESYEKSLNNIRECCFDAVTYLEQLLGENVFSLTDKTESSGGSLISEYFRSKPGNISAEKKSCISAALLGIYGGRWYNRPFGIYYENSPLRRKTIGKKQVYEKIKKNPYSLMLPDNLTISRTPFFVATAAGIDASEIIPPFPPIGRNEDGIWAAVLLAIKRNSFIAHCPYAVYHEPDNNKEFLDKDYEETSADFGILTVLIINFVKKNLLSFYHEITYELFGEQLISLSKMTDVNFISFCHKLQLEYASQSISRLELLLSEYKRKPKYWAKDAKKYINLFEKQLLDPLNSIPGELREYYSAEEAVSFYKHFIKEYGQLIKNWPFIWEEAVNLNKTQGENNG